MKSKKGYKNYLIKNIAQDLNTSKFLNPLLPYIVFKNKDSIIDIVAIRCLRFGIMDRNIGNKRTFINFLPFYDITYIHCLEYKNRRITKAQIQSIVKQMKTKQIQMLLNDNFYIESVSENYKKNYIIAIYNVDATKNIYDYVTESAYEFVKNNNGNTRDVFLDFIDDNDNYIKENDFLPTEEESCEQES